MSIILEYVSGLVVQNAFNLEASCNTGTCLWFAKSLTWPLIVASGCSVRENTFNKTVA